jgi:hypothetical protein
VGRRRGRLGQNPGGGRRENGERVEGGMEWRMDEFTSSSSVECLQRRRRRRDRGKGTLVAAAHLIICAFAWPNKRGEEGIEEGGGSGHQQEEEGICVGRGYVLEE